MSLSTDAKQWRGKEREHMKHKKRSVRTCDHTSHHATHVLRQIARNTRRTLRYDAKRKTVVYISSRTSHCQKHWGINFPAERVIHQSEQPTEAVQWMITPSVWFFLWNPICAETMSFTFHLLSVFEQIVFCRLTVCHTLSIAERPRRSPWLVHGVLYGNVKAREHLTVYRNELWTQHWVIWQLSWSSALLFLIRVQLLFKTTRSGHVTKS